MFGRMQLVDEGLLLACDLCESDKLGQLSLCERLLSLNVLVICLMV